jgi:nitrate/nitrite transporter NarK
LHCSPSDGPYISKGTPFNPRALAVIFRSRDFRASAFGYFGHMWELYGFWAFAPVFLATHLALTDSRNLDISFWAFLIIAAGSIGCAGGGLLSQRFGSARVAVWQLGASGLCCLLSPLAFFAPTPVFLGFLFILSWRFEAPLCRYKIEQFV